MENLCVFAGLRRAEVMEFMPLLGTLREHLELF